MSPGSSNRSAPSDRFFNQRRALPPRGSHGPASFDPHSSYISTLPDRESFRRVTKGPRTTVRYSPEQNTYLSDCEMTEKTQSPRIVTTSPRPKDSVRVRRVHCDTYDRSIHESAINPPESLWVPPESGAATTSTPVSGKRRYIPPIGESLSATDGLPPEIVREWAGEDMPRRVLAGILLT